MTIEHFVLSIGLPAIIFIAGMIYLFNGIRFKRLGQFADKGVLITKADEPAKFQLIVWGRLVAGFVLFTVSVAFVYFFHRS